MTSTTIVRWTGTIDVGCKIDSRSDSCNLGQHCTQAVRSDLSHSHSHSHIAGCCVQNCSCRLDLRIAAVVVNSLGRSLAESCKRQKIVRRFASTLGQTLLVRLS